VRIYAEDPAHHDLPQAGPLLLYREPAMPGVRVDAGVAEGGEITVYYDPMIAKLIVSAETREAARRRALAALRSYAILGIRTNVALLIALLEHPRFVSGDIDTHFVDREGAALRASLTLEPPAPALAVAPLVGAAQAPSHTAAAAGDETDPWKVLRNVRV
jgi:3-methylcrotonyl-CoA carboxylase alpha subunit